MSQKDENHLGTNQQEDTDSSKIESIRADSIKNISCPYCYAFVPANQPECTSCGKIISCPDCHAIVPANQRKCTSCGKTIDRSHSKSGNPKPYIYMLFVAPLVWFLTLMFGNNGYEGALIVMSFIYGITGAVFGNLWPRNVWQWGLLLSIPHWIFFLSLGEVVIEIIQEQPVIGTLLVVQPLIAALLGAYLMVAIRVSGNIK